MGISPLVRLSVNSAKLRYRYGAAACPADECRKRIRMRVSGLKLSVSTQQAIETIVRMPNESSPESTQTATEPSELTESNTDKMIRSILGLGHKGFNVRIENSNLQSHSFSSKGSLKRRHAPSVIPRLASLNAGTIRMRKARIPQALPCSEVINASTAIIDYVFDEPGYEPYPTDKVAIQEKKEVLQERSSDTSEQLPAPVCRISVLLRGCALSYDFQAIADIERVMERLQPVFYDLRSLARKVNSDSGETKRSADGIQIEVDATPKTKEHQEEDSYENPTPLITLPFLPKHATWKNLLAMNLSSRGRPTESLQDIDTGLKALPPSRLSINSSSVSFRTEVPYHLGVPQKSSVSMKDVGINAEGVVEMPVGSSKALTVSRVIHYPTSWKDEHVITSEVQVSDAEFWYLPDTFRILDDVSTTVQTLSRKPKSISYFVPFRETTKIIATQGYSVVIACSHDNVWHDIHAGEADQYGRIIVCGKSGELVISPSTATEFVQDCTALSWSLSLSNAVGKLDLPLSTDPLVSTRGQTIRPDTEATDPVKTSQPKSRTSSLAHFVKTFETFGATSQPQSAPERRRKSRSFAIEVLRTGKSCEISGKVIAHQRRLFLDSQKHSFLDAVNRNELHFKTSTFQFDFNPHHMTHIFNLLRNYAGPGLYTLTSEEASKLAQLKLDTARRVLAEGRYPTATECLTMGLPAGFCLSSRNDRTALDDILFLSFHLDEAVVRLHDQPHALSTFREGNQEVCSIECRKLHGFLSSNRQGHEMSCSPNSGKNVILVTQGYREARGDVHHEMQSSQVERIVPPTTTIQGLQLGKVTCSSDEWGPYTSDLRISIDCVDGCILDTSIARITRFSSNLIPDALHEDSQAVAAMLSVENIELQLSKLNMLVLSAASSSSGDRSGRVNKFFSSSPVLGDKRGFHFIDVPKLLSSVTQVQLPSGLRFVMSDLATEDIATRSRIVLSNISINVLMLWRGQLIPWVDNVTMRAQVAHAMSLGRSSPEDGSQERGVLHCVAQSEGITIDINYDTRPLIWSTRVSARQKLHVARLRSQNFQDRFPWDNASNEESREQPEIFNLLPMRAGSWRTFLDRARKASDIERHTEQKDRKPHHLDSLSLSIPTKVLAFLAPESVQIAIDIVVRAREALSFQQGNGGPTSSASSDGVNSRLRTSDIMELWRNFEQKRMNARLGTTDSIPSNSVKAIETNVVEVVFAPPVFSGFGRDSDGYPSKMQAEAVKLSFPLGICFQHVSKMIPSGRSGKNSETNAASINQAATAMFVSVDHTSVPSLEVVCNGKGLIDMREITFTFRRTVKPVAPGTASMGSEALMSHIRSNTVGRIGSMKIGSKNSELSTYACLGRVLSMFLLLLRTFDLETSALLKAKKDRTAELCELLFGISEGRLITGEPHVIRSFLVQTIRFLESKKDAKTDNATQRTSSSAQCRVPLEVLKDTIKDKDASHYYTDSIDVSLHDFSMKTANHVVIHGDFFQCNGGFRSDAWKYNSSIHGHVLTASLGTIKLSVRDDLVSNALRMVSEVASCVRTAALSMSMVQRGEDENNQGVLECSDLVRRDRNAIRFQTFGNESLPVGQRRFGQARKIRRDLPTATGSRRRPFETRSSPGPLRSHSSLQGRQAFNSNENGDHWLSNEYSGFQKDLISSSESTTVPFSDQTSALSSKKGSLSKRRRPVPKATEVGRPGPMFLRQEVKPEEEGKERNTNRSNGNDENYLEDGRYAYIAVRTAGESGPPLKRAKSMVRLGTIVPPAFFTSNASVPQRKPGSGDDDRIDYKTVATGDSHEGKEGVPFGKSSQLVAREIATSGANTDALRAPRRTSRRLEELQQSRSLVTLFVSCHKVICCYHSGKGFHTKKVATDDPEADIRILVSEPRLTYMSSPQKGSHSIVITSSSSVIQSANDPKCVLTAAIDKIGLKVSIDEGYVPTKMPTLIMSGQISELTTTLHATDLKSVLTFRESFKKDIKGILSAFLRTKQSLSEMAQAIRLSSPGNFSPDRTVFSTLAFDLLCERSRIRLEGFHPEDGAMTVSYVQDGMFFSVVASEDDKAALTLGLRLYGHGLSIASPSWESAETLKFPSIDARGVQWGEATGLPTILKVTTEPLLNSTSVQGLRHVLFTVAGLLAFQNVSVAPEGFGSVLPTSTFSAPVSSTQEEGNDLPSSQVSGAPFTRSFAAWERTKGVRMDISIRPMSLSLASGQVLALFDVDTLTGIFEWNKLVQAGVQLQMGVSVPKVALSFMRMPSSEFTITDARLSENRTSLSIALERSRIDLLKTQEDLTHTFTFRIDVFAVSGQVRPWKLLLDAASWADEQEFVADLQAINYQSISSAKQRHPRVAVQNEEPEPTQHRVILFGANLQRFILAVPLVSTEEYASSRLALRATDLNCFSRQRFHGTTSPKSVMELKAHFIGILWENSPLLSTHHARVAFRVHRPSIGSTAHFGDTSVAMYPGSWRICPRKDVILAILEAKNRKDNRRATEKTRELLAALPDITSYPASSTAGDSVSFATEKQSRLLFESLRMKTFRTSGFIEGLDHSTLPGSDPKSYGLKSHNQVQQASKLSVPAFSVSVVRNSSQTFDIIDVDFSGREGGEFPRGCLGKVSHLLSDLFGAVTADQINQAKEERGVPQAENAREMTRDVSVLIRFGRSLYRAQEAVIPSMEAKFGFFAGKSSSILISLYTATALEDEGSHSTVITGISPRLGLEITPLISGAKVQSLRLTDARFLHGICPSRPLHTVMHINRVTALMEAKTLLLTRNRLGLLPSIATTNTNAADGLEKVSAPVLDSKRKILFLLGKSRERKRSFDGGALPDGKEHKVEPDIRLQMKFPAKNDSTADELDLFVERCVLGISSDMSKSLHNESRFSGYAGFHKLILRGQWDLLGCKLQLREALFCYDFSQVSADHNGLVSTSAILNRLQFESMQYGRNTAKVDIDAVAAMWAIPHNELFVESTSVHAEIAYTLQNAKTKLAGQAKKLRNEVKLLTEKDLSREPRRGGNLSHESTKLDSVINEEEPVRETDEIPDYLSKSSGPKSSRSGGTAEAVNVKGLKSLSRKVFIKGDELVVTMRGYQFDEARQSAEVGLSRYDLRYSCGPADKGAPAFHRYLNIDFDETRLSYFDEDRGISSDLFRIPNPKLNLSVVEGEEMTKVDLQGVLLIALKHGFYYIQDFKNLAELTVIGIVHTTPMATAESSEHADKDRQDSSQAWNGTPAEVTVNLNPKIDVMGDLTEEMLHMNMISSRLGRAEVIPRQMYEFVIVPLEALSDALCDPLYR